MKNYLLIAAVSFTLFGCQLTRVEGRVDDVDVKVRSAIHTMVIMAVSVLRGRPKRATANMPD